MPYKLPYSQLPERIKQRFRDRRKRYYREHTEQVKEASSRYREKNRARVLQAKLDYYNAHHKEQRQKNKEWKKMHPDKIKGHDRTYYQKHKEELRKKANEKYMKPRRVALQRDNFRCRICASEKNLIVHHIDEKFERIKDERKKNHSPENLITLCRNCHNYLTYLIRHRKSTPNFSLLKKLF